MENTGQKGGRQGFLSLLPGRLVQPKTHVRRDELNNCSLRSRKEITQLLFSLARDYIEAFWTIE